VSSSQAATIASFVLRELRTLRREIESYPEERDIWSLPAGLPNSAGTLALHMAGNLQHYVGAILAGDGYVRDRDAEFALRDVPRATIRAEIAAAETAVRMTLPGLTDARLSEPYPEAIRGHLMSTGEFLVQLAVHLAYHLGQVDYHRRTVTGDPQGLGAIDPGALTR
jgi:hypothetical protein